MSGVGSPTDRPTRDEAVRLLHEWTGAARPRLLGQGMEGMVYELDDERVAKIWAGGSRERLVRVQEFYDALAAGPPGFATPRILEVGVVEGRCLTIERRLTGSNTRDRLADGRTTTDEARAVVVDALVDLAARGPLPEARALSVLDEPLSPYDAAEDFPDALAALVERRVARFARVLDPAVADLDRKVAALRVRLHEIDSGQRSVVHGDLFPGNVLLDDAGGLSAVLDWGFLTTEGDPVFDAAVAAAVFDMYGQAALETELGLLAQIEQRLGHRREALLVHRAAYSVITANAYDAEGRDGHFAWCVAALNRPDVVAALLG